MTQISIQGIFPTIDQANATVAQPTKLNVGFSVGVVKHMAQKEA